MSICFNPFETGQGLSTETIKQKPELSKMLDNELKVTNLKI